MIKGTLKFAFRHKKFVFASSALLVGYGYIYSHWISAIERMKLQEKTFKGGNFLYLDYSGPNW